MFILKEGTKTKKGKNIWEKLHINNLMAHQGWLGVALFKLNLIVNEKSATLLKSLLTQRKQISFLEHGVRMRDIDRKF